MPELITSWKTSSRQSWRVRDTPSEHLTAFLAADGKTPDEVLRSLPYDSTRAQSGARTGPDPKRYRDSKAVYQAVGLLYEEGGVVHVTALGQALARWLPIFNGRNDVVFAQHAVYALAACQLRNPTGSGKGYVPTMEVFPFAFMWRAAIDLDGKLNSEEMNRALLKVRNEQDLHTQIARIRAARAAGDLTSLGEEIVTGGAKNDRIIPWFALASFGYLLMSDKRGGDDGYYHVRPQMRDLLRSAAQIRYRHRDFASTGDYVRHVSAAAALPKDLR